MSDCPFCEIVAGRAPAEIVHRWDDALAIVPLNPVTPGHTLIIPNEHVAHALIKPAAATLAMRRATEIAHHPCNLITSVGAAATQTVGHLHLHIVPRRDGDGLPLPWTPRPDRTDLTERLAAAAHDGWMASKRAQGIKSRLAEWGEEFMVPYADLSEKAKDIDRGAVSSVLDAIDAAGMTVLAGVAAGPQATPDPPTPPSAELERQRGYSAGWHAGRREALGQALTEATPDQVLLEETTCTHPRDPEKSRLDTSVGYADLDVPPGTRVRVVAVPTGQEADDDA